MADFQKLGFDRMSQNIARAVNSATGTITTGDITKGEFVEHTTSSSSVEYIKIRERATGCIPVTVWFTNSGSAETNWQLDTANNRIAVKCNTSTPCLFRFYVW